MNLRRIAKTLVAIVLMLPFVAEIEVLGELVWGLGAVGFIYFDAVVGLLVAAAWRVMRGKPCPATWGDLCLSVILLLVLMAINLLWLHNVPSAEA